MKKLLSASLLLLAILTISHTNSLAQQHSDTKLGGGIVYGEAAEAAGINVNATFRISPKVALAPGITFYILDDEDDLGVAEDLWTINLDGHYILDASDEYHIYGIGGLNLATVEYEGNNDSNTELGINLGLGAEYHLDNFSLFSELKYVVSDFDQVVLGAGARFPLN